MAEIERLEEAVVEGKRLGRHIDREAIRNARPFSRREAVPVVSKTWKRNIAILNQGDVGSCTANAGTGDLGTDPIYEALPADHPTLDEAEALKLYSAEEVLLGYGPYPPNDDGGTGPAIAQVTEKAGLIGGFNHYTDLNSMLQALMDGPVIIGINWYTSFDTPDANGVVAIAKGATVRGGHEVLVRSVDAETSMLGLDNSWGTDWGVNGSFSMSFDTMTELLAEGGDCTEFLPLGSPTPPAPPSPPSPPTPTPPNPVSHSIIWWILHWILG